ncbi:MAG TPA: hypothetical protein VHE78_18335 [Gemmatimonadaceae bacterium]|nr:hypothetical protein [Gemmatimonadaceae bacterium]
MRPTIRSSTVVFSLAALLSSAACSSKDAAAKDANGRAIELAPTSGAASPLNDRPLASGSNSTSARSTGSSSPAPSTPRERTAPRAPAMRSGTIGAGTTLAVHSIPNVCTNTHHAGDLFAATLNDQVSGSNGVTIPAGTSMRFRVVESVRSEHSKDHAKLSFVPVSLSVGGVTYPVQGRVTQTPSFNMERVQSTQVQAEKIAAGAAIGAVAGQVIGKDTRSTVIGGVVGAAAGTAVAAGTADYDACVPNTGTITVVLDRPVSVRGS